MDFAYSERVEGLRERLLAFMDRHIYPNERAPEEQLAAMGEPHGHPPIIDELKQRARAEGLWNLFLPDAEHGAGLTNLEYAPLAEIMGRVGWAPEVFNCAAPDTGNMEILAQFGTPDQRERWLLPLLRGEIRSAFAMTEPDVASSDATNIQLRIERRGKKAAQNEIAMIKIVAPQLLTSVANRAMQLFGGAGVSQDTPLAGMWSYGRILHIVDGPDEVHKRALARALVRSAGAQG